MSWKETLKKEMTDEEREEYMKRLMEQYPVQDAAEKKIRESVEGTAEAFREGESLEQYKKRMGFNF